jgi:hypothetical protein
MTGKTEVSKTLDGASCAAFMFSGGMLAAEHAVSNGIAATECYRDGDDAFPFEPVKAAIQTTSRFSSSIATATYYDLKGTS